MRNRKITSLSEDLKILEKMGLSAAQALKENLDLSPSNKYLQETVMPGSDDKDPTPKQFARNITTYSRRQQLKRDKQKPKHEPVDQDELVRRSLWKGVRDRGKAQLAGGSARLEKPGFFARLKAKLSGAGKVKKAR